MSQKDIEIAAEVAADAERANYPHECGDRKPPCCTGCNCLRDQRAGINALLAAGYQLIPPVTGKVT